MLVLVLVLVLVLGEDEWVSQSVSQLVSQSRRIHTQCYGAHHGRWYGRVIIDH
jgi:hypothetical protein